MAFDDLAKHMASRSGKKQPAGSADQIVAEAAKADRRANRTRDLILGPILLVGGAGILLLYYLVIVEANDPTPHPDRPPSPSGLYPVWISAAVIAMVTGLFQTIRGLIGRSRG